ncbi:MAG: hypothetical protein Q4E83_04940 [bacterium]|nr:hypothetical protein [bacterium]
MKVSAISQISDKDYDARKNLFIRYTNSFMSTPEGINPIEKANIANVSNKNQKLGIENLQEFTIFPKQIVDGKTVITA